MRGRILIADGAMGTELDRLGLSAPDFGGEQFLGCNDHLPVSKPEAVRAVHEAYLRAGADIIETCSFCASPVMLREFGLETRAREINAAAAQVARSAAGEFSSPEKPRFAAGSMGPTSKSLFLSEGISFDELRAGYLEQALGLAEGGVDAFIIETATDILNIKAAADAAFEAARVSGRDIPVIISASLGAGGKMLSGQDAAALYTALAHYPLLALGFNCAAGPDEMAGSLGRLAALSKFPLTCMPNAGMPDENGRFRLSPEIFSEKMAAFARGGLLNIAGGCCGTTPEHIKELSAALRGIKPRVIPSGPGFALSGIEAVFADKVPPPMLVGERANSIGSRDFRNLIAASDWNGAAAVVKRQSSAGAHIIDVCLSNPERDEAADIAAFAPLAARSTRLPLMIDTTSISVAEAALKLWPGKSVWNSVNLESGPDKMQEAARLNRRHGCALVIGCIDESGKDSMAVTRQRKLEIAERAAAILRENGVPDEDMIFDGLVFPAASGDDKYRGAALETVKALELFREKFPRSRTLLGVSNVSFGLPAAAREALNSIFLHHSAKAGLGMAIVNVEKLRPYESLSAQERELGEKLLFAPEADTAAQFAGLYRDKAKVQQTPAASGPGEKLFNAVKSGDAASAAQSAGELAKTMPADQIINGPLARAMAEVGVSFSKGDMIVTEVLQSAEAMRAASAALKPHLQSGGQVPRGKLLLATVRGDVHDIGKNLVRMIFESNGFSVEDMGVKVPSRDIVGAALRLKPDIIGLSGLLTKSAEAMTEVCAELSAAGLEIPVLAGGAALSRKFVELKLAPVCKGGAHYAADAMIGLAVALDIVRHD